MRIRMMKKIMMNNVYQNYDDDDDDDDNDDDDDGDDDDDDGWWWWWWWWWMMMMMDDDDDDGWWWMTNDTWQGMINGDTWTKKFNDMTLAKVTWNKTNHKWSEPRIELPKWPLATGRAAPLVDRLMGELGSVSQSSGSVCDLLGSEDVHSDLAWGNRRKLTFFLKDIEDNQP